MVVIILAAGLGTRFNNVSECDKRPKCLIEIKNSKVLLDLNLKSLVSVEEVKKIIIVTGYKHELINKHVQLKYPTESRIVIAYNPDYQKSVVHSVKKGFEYIGQTNSVLLLNGDTYFKKIIFEKVGQIVKNKSSSITLFGNFTDDFLDDDMLVKVINGKVENVGKIIKNANAVSSGAILLCNRGLQKYLHMLNNKSLEKLKTHHSILKVIINTGFEVDFSNLGMRNWYEIDTEDDLNNIKKNLTPKLLKT